ncbi:acyl-CoA thioesterase [Mucilaginibacter sp. KACC 22063]|uniref:acyl-CoA thioesterase n=1 Tax=Mucilaginibacter sp. KACC 22063 TaxID=3025666 RepID=UPI002365D9A6|nr:thioesterase family protein [Mucilaginibacter sp. KACC 22063]WDF53881.1 thioesterase family protein [Mucilaginibacter sp. KACC 22063]
MRVYYEGQVLWSQIDANQHMRHSAYADVAAQARLNMLEEVGLNPLTLLNARIGPVLFKEELFYLREIALGDIIKVGCELYRSRADGSRWSIRHEIYRGDDVKAAIINVDGAWIDMDKRKLTLLPEELSALFAASPRSSDYVEETVKPKE